MEKQIVSEKKYKRFCQLRKEINSKEAEPLLFGNLFDEIIKISKQKDSDPLTKDDCNLSITKEMSKAFKIEVDKQKKEAKNINANNIAKNAFIRVLNN